MNAHAVHCKIWTHPSVLHGGRGPFSTSSTSKSCDWHISVTESPSLQTGEALHSTQHPSQTGAAARSQRVPGWGTTPADPTQANNVAKSSKDIRISYQDIISFDKKLDIEWPRDGKSLCNLPGCILHLEQKGQWHCKKENGGGLKRSRILSRWP